MAGSAWVMMLLDYDRRPQTGAQSQILQPGLSATQPRDLDPQVKGPSHKYDSRPPSHVLSGVWTLSLLIFPRFSRTAAAACY